MRFIFLFITLFAGLSFGEVVSKTPPQLTAILNSVVTPEDLFLLYDDSAGITKKYSVTEADKRYSKVNNPTFTGTLLTFESAEISPSELGRLEGVSSNIQNQFDLKAPLTSPTFLVSARFGYSTASRVPYLDSNKDLVASSVTPTELGYLSGVTSAIQTQLGTKAPLASPTFTTSARFSYATVSTVPYFDASKDLVSSAVTPTELGYLSGVTSAIQTQLGTKAPLASPTFTTSARFNYATVSTVPYLDSNKDLVSSSVTPTELGYLSGVTSAIQTQLGTKAPLASPTFTTSARFSYATATTVPYLDASKDLVSSSVTPTELGYLSGVTSAIQTQLGTKAPLASPTFTTSARFSYATATTVPYLDSNKDLISSAVTPTELGYLSGVSSALQTQMNLKAPLASPTFTGTVTLPSGSVTSSAWSAGTSDFSTTGRVSAGTTSNIFATNEKLRGKLDGTTGMVAQSAAAASIQITEAHDSPITNNHWAVLSNVSRTNTSSVTDTGRLGGHWTRLDVANPAFTLTNSNSTMGWAGYTAGVPSFSGSLAFTHWSGFFVEASSAVTGTNKYGVYVGAQSGANAYNVALFTATPSGATNNATISDNISFSGAYAINLSTTRLSQLAGRLFVGGSSGLGTDTAFGIGRGAAALVSGTSQWGIFNGPSWVSTAVTSIATVYGGQVHTDGSGGTIGQAYYSNASTASKNASDTITRLANYFGANQTAGTNNAFLTDNATYTGNWFIHSTSTNPSLFSGIVDATAGLKTKVSTANTANPPTNAELISAFGAAATVGAGFHALVDDNNGHTNEYFVWSDGTKYWYATGTAAP